MNLGYTWKSSMMMRGHSVRTRKESMLLRKGVGDTPGFGMDFGAEITGENGNTTMRS
jgi:hypothetical protein